MLHRRVVLPVVAVALALGMISARPVPAATPTETIQAFFGITNTILKAAALVGDQNEPRQAIRSLADKLFDYDEAAELALGTAWKSRTVDEQAAFVGPFADTLEREFLDMIGSRVSAEGGLQVTILSETVKDDVATMSTTILTRSGEALPMDYSMLRRHGRWVVRDVTVDGESLIGAWRKEFAGYLGGSSFSALVRAMGGGAIPPRRSRSRAAPAPPVQAPPIPPPPIRIAPRPETPPPPASAPADNQFWVQVGAFKSAEAAARVVEELQGLGLSASSSPPSGALIRVRVGPFSTRAAAESSQRDLGARGYAGFISTGGH